MGGALNLGLSFLPHQEAPRIKQETTRALGSGENSELGAKNSHQILSPNLIHAEGGPYSEPSPFCPSVYKMKEVDWLLSKCLFYKYPLIVFFIDFLRAHLSLYVCVCMHEG